MSKNSSPDLFHLVKSLSKSEKRFFKLFISRYSDAENKKFVRLFDLLDRQKNYNEKAILQKEPSINPTQLSNLKAHLYKQILTCLRLCNSSEIIDLQIRELTDHARLLYEKCLYQQCVKMLDKAKKLAITSDRTILLMNIHELEKLVLIKTVTENNDKRVNRIIQETETSSRSLENINAFSNLSVRLNALYVKMGFIRNKSDFEKVSRLFHSSLPKDLDSEKLSFHEKLYLYYCFAGFYFFTQNFKDGYRYSKMWVELFDKHPEMVIPRIELYIKGINNLLVAQSKLYRYQEFVQTKKRLDELSKISGLTDNLQLMLFKYSYVHEINRHFLLGDFKGGISLVSSIEIGMEKFTSRLDEHYVLIFYYKIACLYFGNSQYKECIVWLNKIINHKDISLREDILAFARILNLISHYELGNNDTINYLIDSTYRFISKKGDLHKYQTIILNFLKKVSVETSDEELLERFAGLKKELLKLVDNPYEKRPFIYFDIISWLESKIEGKSVQEIIRKKAMKKLEL